MRTFIARLAFVAAASLYAVGLGACTADVHDNTVDVHDNTANIDNAKVEFDTSVDTENINAGQSVRVEIVAEDVFLIDPAETPPADRVKVAGHFEFFFDSMTSSPLLVTAEKSVDVMIPSDAAPGEHKLLCRVAKHDGTPTEATFEMSITVKARLTTIAH